MPDDISRKKFEREYKDWLVSTARDAAQTMASMSPRESALMAEAYKRMMDPGVVFRKLSAHLRIERLGGQRGSCFIMLETDAVTFFPSLSSSMPGMLDFAVAMNRRLFLRDLWFPIISLNSEYIKQSSDRVLEFALEHEFEMSRIYQEISLNLRSLLEDEKRDIMRSAKQKSAKKLSITQEGLIEDEELMVHISKTQPLIPKPYAEMALLLYLDENFTELRDYGIPSRNDEERSFGEELYEEFRGWSDFSRSTFALFVRELLSGIRDASRGYG